MITLIRLTRIAILSNSTYLKTLAQSSPNMKSDSYSFNTPAHNQTLACYALNAKV
jgi:hypothetical protein